MRVIIIQAIEGVSLEIIHYVVGQVVPLEAQAQCLTEIQGPGMHKPSKTNQGELNTLTPTIPH